MPNSAYDQKDNFFSVLREPVEEAVERLVSEKNANSEQVEAFLRHLIAEGAPSLAESLKRGAPEMLQEERRFNSDFEARNLDRWEVPLNLLRVLWKSAQEAGEAHAHCGPPEGADDTIFSVLCVLQPKALLISNEIICLLEGGFADGALARWRALHEVTVTAMFIASNDRKTARDYVLNGRCQDYNAAIKFNEYAERNHVQPLSETEINKLRTRRDGAEALANRRLRRDLDWAAPALGRTPKQNVTFFELEKSVGMDHWRPRYKWACQHNHAGFNSPSSLLGMSEASEPMHQVGPSNSGMADPLHMTAISLLQMTTTFLNFPQPCFGRLVTISALQCLSDELGAAALEAQKHNSA